MRLILIIAFGISLTANAQKKVAITFDDLVMGGGELSFDLMKIANEQIVKDCKAYDVPAIGFVNEKQLYKNDELSERTLVLQHWLENGLELGNHTYSHPSFFKTPLGEYKQNVLKGEMVTRPLMAEKGLALKYFRHPYLNTGSDSLTRAHFESFLDSIGYQVAPVTVESSDYIFNKVYLDAYRKGDSTLMTKVGQAYVDHTLVMFDFMDSVSNVVIGRSISQVYLCHANHLNAAYMPQIYERLQNLGYEFGSLEEVMKDEAYESTDHYVGPWGISWLYRWDKGKTKEWLQAEPEIDEEILSLYQN